MSFMYFKPGWDTHAGLNQIMNIKIYGMDT